MDERSNSVPHGAFGPHSASVLLAKPTARWLLLLGKYIGVLTFVGFQVVLFVGLTWLALGLRTGVWDRAYLWCVPLLVLQFAVFYSFSVLLAVLTRSTVACVFGSVLFWLVAWGINYGSVMAVAAPDTSLPRFTAVLIEQSHGIVDRRGLEQLERRNDVANHRHNVASLSLRIADCGLRIDRRFNPK